MQKLETFNQSQLKNLQTQGKKELPEIRSGDTIVVYQKIKEKDKERIQPFRGLLIARKHGKGINATITVRKISAGIGVEKIFPIHSPNIDKIEVLRRPARVRRAKLYYVRRKAQKAIKKRLKAVQLKKETGQSTKEKPEKAKEKPEEKPEDKKD